MLAEPSIKRTFTVQHKSEPTCSQCQEFDNGLCKLRAIAEWENCYVKLDKTACSLASIVPF